MNEYIVTQDWIKGDEVGEPIVRCKDCVYFDKYENDEIRVCCRFNNEQPIVEPYGFCAWAKRW